MEELVSWVAVLNCIIVLYSFGYGVNLKKWYGWVQVLSGFSLGFFMAVGLVPKIAFSILFGIATLVGGPIAWKRLHK